MDIRNQYRIATLLLCLTLLTASACQRPVREPPPPSFATAPIETQPAATQPAPQPQMVTPERVTGAGVEPADLFPLQPGTWTYRVVQGKQEGEEVEQVLRRVDDPETPWRLETPGQRIEHLRLTESGDLVVPAVEDLKHNVITRYEPALPVLPAGLTQGEPVVVETSVTIHNRNNPDVIRDRGQAIKTVTLEGIQQIDTPAGSFRAHRVRTDYQADLGLAKVNSTDIIFYEEGIGMVAEQQNERVKALFLGWNENQELLLVAPPKGQGE